MSERGRIGGRAPGIEYGGGFPENQPPPMGPGGMPEPPPGMPGGYMPGPAPQEGSSAWMFLLLGCGGLLLIGLLVGGGSCYYMAKKTPEMISGIMGLGAAEFSKSLTPDHDDDQRERFEKLINAVLSTEMERLGLVKWAENYQPELDKLNIIAQDGAITVEESEQWCDQAFAKLEEMGYWGEDE